MRKLRILIADDHALIRRGARGVLQKQRGWRVVGEASNGREAVEKAKKLRPDITIVDISMPESDGVETTRQIRDAVPSTKVLVLSMHDSEQMVQSAFDAGAQGYILKSDLTDCLVKAIKDVSAGNRFLTPRVSEIVLEGFLRARGHRPRQRRAKTQPTPRELDIVRLLANGKANKEIAWELGIAVRTVEAHRSNVMRKLGLHSLAELIRFALRHKIVPTEGKLSRS